MAQTACSLDEPQPKLLFETRILPFLYGFLLSINSEFSSLSSLLSNVAVSLYVRESNKNGTNTDFFIYFKYCFGIIKSVSTLSLLIGMACPL